MKILVIQHTPGNTLEELESVFEERKLDYEYALSRELTDSQIALDQVNGLIILGGAESVTEERKNPHLVREQMMIRDAISRKIPVLGICLGSQVLAAALGAKVSRNRYNGQDMKEVGWTPIFLNAAGERDPVLRHLEGQSQFQWHEDTFEIPEHAVHLAESELCPSQAFRLDESDVPVYGVQFHPEVTPAVIKLWLRESKNLPEAAKEAIWQETEKRYKHSHAASRAMLSAFRDLAF